MSQTRKQMLRQIVEMILSDQFDSSLEESAKDRQQPKDIRLFNWIQPGADDSKQTPK